LLASCFSPSALSLSPLLTSTRSSPFISRRWDARQASLKEKLNQGQAAVGNAVSTIGDLAAGTADIVAQTTAMVASFLTEDLKGPIEGSEDVFRATSNLLSETVGTVNSMVKKLAHVLSTAAPKLPSWDTIKDPKAWPQSLMTYCQQVSEAMSELVVEANTVYNGIEANFCSPAVVIPSHKKRGKVEGPAFKLKLSSGECEFAYAPTSTLKDKDIEVLCKTPKLEFEKTPAKYTSKHHSPVKFKTKECKREISKGEEAEIVLFEINPGFDLKSALDQASSRISGAFDGLLGEHDQLTGDLKAFAEQMVADGDQTQLSETVAKYDQAALEVASGLADGLITFSTGSGQTFSNGMMSLPGGWTYQTVSEFSDESN